MKNKPRARTKKSPPGESGGRSRLRAVTSGGRRGAWQMKFIPESIDPEIRQLEEVAEYLDSIVVMYQTGTITDPTMTRNGVDKAIGMLSKISVEIAYKIYPHSTGPGAP
jgi:hypothetical protein